jgi:hemerythrin-like domain-containing protein
MLLHPARTGVGSHEFPAKAGEIRALIERHVAEEERDMFPRARKLLSRSELDSLGARCAERKADLGVEVKAAP